MCALRLRRHRLTAPASSTAVVAADICGVHAQMMPAAELQLGLRLSGVTRTGVQSALWTERVLVKTFGPRGTVHLFPAGELSLWMSGLAHAASLQSRSLPAQLRLTTRQRDAIIEAISDVLGGAELTIDELDREVVARAGPWAEELVMPAFDGMWPRWRIAISDAAYRGALCFGPNRGRKVTYTRPEGVTPAPGSAALAEILIRYLKAYGPATPQHFAQWLSIGKRGAAELFESVADRLVPVEVENWTGWLPADSSDVPDASDVDDGLRLLPHFDPYVVGCHPRELVFPGRAAERALSRGQAGTMPVLLIGGVVAGVWHARRNGRKIAITVEPFGTLTARRRRELDDQTAKVAGIMEATPAVTIGEVTAGRHL